MLASHRKPAFPAIGSFTSADEIVFLSLARSFASCVICEQAVLPQNITHTHTHTRTQVWRGLRPIKPQKEHKISFSLWWFCETRFLLDLVLISRTFIWLFKHPHKSKPSDRLSLASSLRVYRRGDALAMDHRPEPEWKTRWRWIGRIIYSIQMKPKDFSSCVYTSTFDTEWHETLSFCLEEVLRAQFAVKTTSRGEGENFLVTWQLKSPSRFEGRAKFSIQSMWFTYAFSAESNFNN